MKQDHGFMMVMAIFMLVVLSLLGSYMVRLSGTQHTTVNASLQGARAYQAAKAGIAWGIATIKNGGGCANVNAQADLTLPGLDGFGVTLFCVANTYSEGEQTEIIYRLNAQSAYGSYDSGDYVSRRLEASIHLSP